MPEWMIWMAVVWVFFAIRGRHGCGWGGVHRGHLRGGHGRYAPGTPERPVHLGTARGARLAGPRGAARYGDLERVGAARSRGRPAPRPETVEERLQRQFVEGRLTIEEYEEALWEEIGGR